MAATTATEIAPQVAWDGSNFLVVWRRHQHAAPEIVVARVSAAGALLDPAGVVVAGRISSGSPGPTVAGGGPAALVAWVDADGGVRASRISRAGGVLDPGGRVVRPTSAEGTVLTIPRWVGFEPAWTVSAAWDGSNYLVAWDAGYLYYTVWANRIDGSTGAALDGGGFPVAMGPGGRYSPQVAGGPGGFMVVWTDGRGDPYRLYPWYSVYAALPPGEDLDLYGARITSQGTVLDPDGLVIAPGRGAQSRSALRHGGNGWLLVLEDTGASWTSSRIAKTSVEGLPSLSPATAVDPSSASQFRPALSVGASGRALVVWEERRCGARCSEIWAAVISTGSATPVGRVA